MTTNTLKHVKISCTSAPKNLHMPYFENADHWCVRLYTNEHEMHLFYSKGVGLRESGRNGTTRPIKPSLEEVVECLCSDAVCVDGYNDWLDWALDFGFEGADNLKNARNTFNLIMEQTKTLTKLGIDPHLYLELTGGR